MALFLRYIIFCAIVYSCVANVTRINRNNVLLSRRKRYLLFPMGSNFVISLSGVKAIMQVQPKGWNILVEVDFPFALPSDTTFFKNLKNKTRHQKERRDVYSRIELGLTQGGLNGTACVRKMICDVQNYISLKGKSLVRDILLAIFTSPDAELDVNYQGACDDNMWSDCSVPFIDYILKSIHGDDNY